MTPDEALVRLALPLRRDQPPTVYCPGGLAELCADGLTLTDKKAKAWRAVRKAAQDAAAQGRCILHLQRNGDRIEYIAVGLE